MSLRSERDSHFSINSPFVLYQQAYTQRHCKPMKNRNKTIALITIYFMIVVIGFSLFAYTHQPSNLPITYLETYRGHIIYKIEGYNDDYYLTQSPYNQLCEVYINLGDFKADVDQEENEKNIQQRNPSHRVMQPPIMP
jgi:hypothetical protein